MTEKELVIYYRNVNNNHMDKMTVNLPDNSGEILSMERNVKQRLHSRYGRISEK